MTRRFVVLVSTLMVVVMSPVRSASADGPSGCARYQDGYCIEWTTPGGGGLGINPRTNPPQCWWQTIGDPSWDPTIYLDYGIPPPPPGVEVIWQAYTCLSGPAPDRIRWVMRATPQNLAVDAFGRIAGRLPAPVASSDPPPGTPAVVNVPVFVRMDNWTGTTADSSCAGALCVTVSATPLLSYLPGEPGAAEVQCAGGGSRYDPNAGDPQQQAARPGACAFSYTRRTGTPDRPAAWPAELRVTWTITWSASDGSSGALQPVVLGTAMPRAVNELQSLVRKNNEGSA